MMDISTYIIFIAIRSYIGIKHAQNDFERIRWIETARLYLPLAEKETAQFKMIENGIDSGRPKFYGRNPLTGMPVTVVFNELTPNRSSVMNWNMLTRCWFYSEDAGLSWQRVENDRFNEFVVKADCLMDEPKYNGR